MQVPAQFEYQRATSVEHAIALLNRHGPESRVLAGGHSLIPMMKLRLAQPEMLIDINDLTELAGLHFQEGVLRLGALLRHADLLASPEVGLLCPMLHDAERVIADPVVRNRGTVGGSVCQADPSEDLSGVFCALRAVAVIRGCSNGGEAYTRTVPMREFFTGPYQTVVADAELLVELQVLIFPDAGSAYVKVDRRSGDWRSPPRRRWCGSTATRSPTWGSGSPPSGGGTSWRRRRRSTCAVARLGPSTSRRQAGSPRNTAHLPTTSAARPTTSGTWRAS
jgi:carbon-monoxide dehydrogenase medium subunit